MEKLIEDVFENSRDIGEPQTHAKQKSEFVFHVIDCKDDVLRLARRCSEPGQFDEAEAKEIISAALYHAVGHLIAAARLYDYVPDPFKSAE